MMKKLLPLLVFMAMTAANADTNQDAYNAGSSFGKGNSSQGTGSLNNPGSVTGSIPGYTENPPQSDYYGGVKGGDSGLADKGLSEMQGNDAAQSIIESGTKNPPPTISSDATYITTGKDAEKGAESVLDGTGQQCTEVTVSKSTFEDFKCDKDVASVESCSRTGSASGHFETTQGTETFVINAPKMSSSFDGSKGFYFTFPAPATGKVISAKVYWYTSSKGTINYLTWWGLNNVQLKYQGPFNYSLPSAKGYPLTKGTNVPRAHVTNQQCLGADQGHCGDLAKQYMRDMKSGVLVIRVTLVMDTTVETWVPDVVWNESCPFDKTKGKPTGSVCIDPGGERTVTVNGKNYQVYSDCWGYSDNYVLPVESTGTCGTLMDDPQCTVSNQTCLESTDGECTHMGYTYQCQRDHTSGGLVCGGDYFCKTGECDATNGAGDNGFDEAVAKLAGLASAGEDVANSQDEMNVRAFTGETMSCRKAFAGFSNCCKDSGWGADVGLAHCNDDEMALGKAKAKKVTVSVGTKCDHKVLGVCVQKSQVYCVFQGKLARIIQEQGRRDQLGVSFGSGDNPDCRGITVDELQHIDFDRVNFSDFYEDLMNNQKIPDTGTMVQQVKDRIAAQVQQQQNNGGK